ncbi:hypothetical protein QQF64_029282 [Cirrhinus molitorella]|uniref:Uncharacterized protein n=1 Tax=Cirrhinus molitorella TaxID=172907 RepID=A0ABR3N928_9TELE
MAVLRTLPSTSSKAIKTRAALTAPDTLHVQLEQAGQKKTEQRQVERENSAMNTGVFAIVSTYLNTRDYQAASSAALFCRGVEMNPRLLPLPCQSPFSMSDLFSKAGLTRRRDVRDSNGVKWKLIVCFFPTSTDERRSAAAARFQSGKVARVPCRQRAERSEASQRKESLSPVRIRHLRRISLGVFDSLMRAAQTECKGTLKAHQASAALVGNTLFMTEQPESRKLINSQLCLPAAELKRTDPRPISDGSQREKEREKCLVCRYSGSADGERDRQTAGGERLSAGSFARLTPRHSTIIITA